MGGANARACAWDSSALCSNNQSSHISERKKSAMQLNRVCSILRSKIATHFLTSKLFHALVKQPIPDKETTD